MRLEVLRRYRSRIRWSGCLVLALTAFASIPSTRQASAAAPKLDHEFGRWPAIVHRELAGHLAGGYAFAVARGGRVVESGVFGWARTPRERERPGLRWSLDTHIAVASVSKTITATALLHLWDETHHSFSLDDPFWPYLRRLVPDAAADVKTITIRQLLRHQSGIPNEKDAQNIGDLRNLLKQKLEFAPGSKSVYHNNNFYILGVLLEQIAHTPYTRYVREQVLAPMGVTGMNTAAPHPLEASGYAKLGIAGPSFPFDWNMAEKAGAAGWYGSVNDLIVFLQHVRDPSVLSKEAWKEMWNDQMGWDRRQPGLAQGGDFGWSSPEGSGEMHSAIVLYPDDVQAVLLINAATPRGPTDVLNDAWTETRVK